jgi:hypothetical protein
LDIGQVVITTTINRNLILKTDGGTIILLGPTQYLNVYLLSPEDIIVSKIIRLEQKDIEDIDKLMETADKELVNQIIEEVLSRNDLYESKRDLFIKKLQQFKEKYNV